MYGLYANDETMRKYVDFICAQIDTRCGASVNAKDGFPMKGYYVPVKLEIKEKLSRSAEMKITVLGYEKEFIFFMSRHKSPDALLHELQRKIDELTLEIIRENNLDQDKIYREHHPLRNLKL